MEKPYTPRFLSTQYTLCIQRSDMKNRTKNPLVSVVMPVKDAGEFVGQAVESIQKQTYKNWELIVINDGSRDKTGTILSRFSKKDKRIRVITHTKPKGIGVSLNEAIKLSKGKYIARMDGDDISLPSRLDLQVKYLTENTEIVAVGGQVEMIDGKGVIFAYKYFPTEAVKLREVIMWMVPMQHPAMMVRGDIYRKCSYDENLKTAEDVDMMMQLLQYGEFGNIDQKIFQYRKADTSNGYHNVKTTFWLTLLGRIRGICLYGYKPSIKGLAITIAQVLVVGVLPSKWIVRLYESRRFLWRVQEHVSRWILLKRLELQQLIQRKLIYSA